MEDAPTPPRRLIPTTPVKWEDLPESHRVAILASQPAFLEAQAPPAPSLLEKAGSFVKAATTQVMAGNPIASVGVQAERRSLCLGCEDHDHERDSCRRCGCALMELKRKWLTSQCPVNKW